MVYRTKIKIGWKPKMKTKVVVLDAIRTAMKPEKMFWGAEIEIYRLVMSKGSQGTGKTLKLSVCFWISGPVCKRNVVDHHIFDVLVSGSALKVQISMSKISFRSKFDQKSLLAFLWILISIFQFRVFGFVTFLQNFNFSENSSNLFPKYKIIVK